MVLYRRQCMKLQALRPSFRAVLGSFLPLFVTVSTAVAQPAPRENKGTARSDFKTIGRTDGYDFDLDVRHISELVGNVAYQSQMDISDAIFNALSDFNISLSKDIDIKPRRYVFDNNNGKFTVLDQFTLQYTHNTPITPWSSFGNQEGISISKISLVDNPRTVTTPIVDENAYRIIPKTFVAKLTASAFWGVEWIVDKVFTGVEKGVDGVAKFFVDNDFDKIRYNNTLSEFRLPAHIPFSADELLDNERFKVGDIVSYNLYGGVFLNASTIFNFVDTAGSYATAYVRGNWQVSVRKEKNNHAIIRLRRSFYEGANFTPLGIRLHIPIIKGVLFGKSDINFNFTPFHKSIEAAEYQVFDKVYKYDLNTEIGRKAYTAAMFGNFKPTHEHMNNGSAVSELMLRNAYGTYQRSNTRINISVVNIDKHYINNVEFSVLKKHDKTENVFLGSSERMKRSYISLFGFYQDYKKFTRLDSFDLLNDDQKSTKKLEISSSLIIENKETSKENYAEMIQIARSIVGNDAIPDNIANRHIQGGQKLSLEMFFRQAGVLRILQMSEDKIWSVLSRYFLADATAWATQTARTNWIFANQKNKFRSIEFGGPAVPAQLYIKRASVIVDTFTQMKKTEDAKKRLKLLNKLHEQNGYSSLLYKLLIELAGKEQVEYRLKLHGEGLEQPFEIEYNLGGHAEPPKPIDPFVDIDNRVGRDKKILFAEVFRRKSDPSKLYLAIETNYDLAKTHGISVEQRRYIAFKKDPVFAFNTFDNARIASYSEQVTDAKFRYELEIPQVNINAKSITLQTFINDNKGNPVSEVEEIRYKTKD